MSEVYYENQKSKCKKRKLYCSRYIGFISGAVARGDKNAEALAQKEMDKAMADMISPNTDANRKFKEASNAKRGAHSKDLEASAQKKMDDTLADMLSGKDWWLL